MYALFSTIEDFNQWHTSVKTNLGLPDGLGTIEYTTPVNSMLEGSISVFAYIDNQVDSEGLVTLTREELISLGHYVQFELSI
jgi:hypothetical protein